jgi:hypothetical protein
MTAGDLFAAAGVFATLAAIAIALALASAPHRRKWFIAGATLAAITVILIAAGAFVPGSNGASETQPPYVGSWTGRVEQPGADPPSVIVHMTLRAPDSESFIGGFQTFSDNSSPSRICSGTVQLDEPDEKSPSSIVLHKTEGDCAAAVEARLTRAGDSLRYDVTRVVEDPGTVLHPVAHGILSPGEPPTGNTEGGESGTPTSDSNATFVYPEDGQTVDSPLTVTGRATLDQDRALWLVLKPDENPLYFVTTDREVDVDHSGNWSSGLHLGNGTCDEGDRYKLYAVAAPRNGIIEQELLRRSSGQYYVRLQAIPSDSIQLATIEIFLGKYKGNRVC